MLHGIEAEAVHAKVDPVFGSLADSLEGCGFLAGGGRAVVKVCK